MARLHVNEGPSVPQGVYKLKFERISSRDNDEPVAKSTDSGPKVYFDLTVVEGDHAGETVPASTDLDGGLRGYCLLFSGSPPKSRNLVEIEQQIKAADKVVEMAVNDSGWCRGPMVPKGTYMAKFMRFTKRDGDRPVVADAEFQGKPYKKAFWTFEVAVGDYAGTQVPASCPYAVNQKGAGLEISSKSNMYSWLTACGVDFSALPEFEDSANVLPELEAVMQKKGRLVILQVGDNGWVASGAGSVVEAPAGMAPTKKEEISGDDKLGDLFVLMRKIAEKEKLGEMFDQSGVMTDAGKKFAKERVGPICDQHGVPRKFKDMNAPQVQVIIDELNKQFDPSGEQAFMGSDDGDDVPF